MGVGEIQEGGHQRFVTVWKWEVRKKEAVGVTPGSGWVTRWMLVLCSERGAQEEGQWQENDE